jgi:chromosomal replication initiation ATPase DnaA
VREPIESIVRRVACFSGQPVDVLRGRERTKPVSRARHAAFISCRMAGHNLTDIAAYFGRCHSTVLYGLKKEA